MNLSSLTNFVLLETQQHIAEHVKERNAYICGNGNKKDSNRLRFWIIELLSDPKNVVDPSTAAIPLFKVKTQLQHLN